MDVHLRDLRYFVAVAEHLHFGQAADALFISQPALSKQIRSLETQLRVELFVRDRRSVRLTPAGEALLSAARAVLDAWQGAESDLAAASAESGATLLVGMSTGLGRGLLPAVRARFAVAAPRATFRLRQVTWDDPTGGLVGTGEGASDAAFVWLPLPEPERYRWLVVAEEPRLVLLPSAHPLASREAIDIADLLDQPFLALPRSAGPLRDYWLALDARDGQPPIIGAEIASTDETAEALLAGLGVCLIASGNAAPFRRDGVAIRPVSGLSDSQLALAWRANDTRPLLRHLVSATAEALPTQS